MQQNEFYRNRRSRPSRKYGFACSNCRRRKAKCDGAMPACQKCLSSREKCSYDKAPSVAYAVSLQNQLQAYKDRIEKLRQVKDEDRDAILNQPIGIVNPNEGRSRAFRSPPEHEHDSPQQMDDVATEGKIDAAEKAFVGQDGLVYFYGKTSLYYIGVKNLETDSPAAGLTASGEDGYDSSTSQLLTPKVPDTTMLLASIPSDILASLLDAYWCYPHHFHCVLCKTIFLRDLYTLGPHVTPFLLCAVLSQAARYSTLSDAAEIGQNFASKAIQFLPSEIEKGSSVPTLQGLLIISARECACGGVSQGWLYSGMAFRMMRDLGIDVSPKKLRLEHLTKQFSEEDLKLRHQLFWSCYTWDKTISVCLGRAPMVQYSVELPTPDTLPFSHEADNESWPPTAPHTSFGISPIEQKALSSMRFVAYCELSTITESILSTLYSRQHDGQQQGLLAYLDSTIQKLESWVDRLPSQLFISENTTAIVSPPLHILLLNLMYHAITILLCRPYRTVQPAAKERCTKAAKMVDTLFVLHVKSFGFQYITYLQTYTLFVACTVNVLDLTENEGADGDSKASLEANSRLRFGLEVFRQANTTPTAVRCAGAISQLLKRQRESKQKQENNSARNTAQTAIDCATAFDPDAQGSGLEPEARNPTFPTSCRTPAWPNLEPGATTEAPYIQGQNFEPYSATETALEWLPGNVEDDGNWLLMTGGNLNADFDFSMVEDFSWPRPECS
ncbi:hypothetical protein M426DRAFT_147102 [Hypoxylon sp. CI-4A]|nr:hypothetical protein M426DRAFT_147102 [Hypoxylon sp. CI-4A]